MAVLLTAVEALPIGFSVACGRTQRRGFPIIYTNRHFEVLTGYDRAQVVGQNLKFLQCAFTEESAVEEVSSALRQCQPVQVVITNQTKSGGVYKNLMALKPIFNEKKDLLYYFSLHLLVIESADGYKAKEDFMRSLMALLPDVVNESRH